MDAGKQINDAESFFAGKDGEQPVGPLGPRGQDGFNVLMKYFPVEEEDGAESLVLRGSGEVVSGHEMGKEIPNPGRAHLVEEFFAIGFDFSSPDSIMKIEDGSFLWLGWTDA